MSGESSISQIRVLIVGAGPAGIGVGLAGGALLGWAWCSLMDYTGTRASAPVKVKTVEKEPDHSGSPVAKSLPAHSYALATP